MSFISSTWSLMKRHKRKLVFGCGFVGGMVMLNKYLSQVERSWEKSSSRGYVTEVRKKDSHYEATIKSSNSNSIDAAKKIARIIEETLQVNALRSQLDAKQHDLYREFGVRVFTRIISDVYCNCLVVCYLRIQLCIVAGMSFCDYTKNGTIDQINTTVQSKYYQSVLNTFYEEGITHLVGKVKQIVSHELQSIELSDEIKFDRCKDIFMKMEKKISDNLQNFLFDVTEFKKQLSVSNFSENDRKVLSDLFDSTQDLLESEDFVKTIRACVGVGFSLIYDQLVGSLVQHKNHSTDDKEAFVDPKTISIPFALLIPKLVCSENQRDINNSELVRHLQCLDILNCFSYNIFESFSSNSNV